MDVKRLETIPPWEWPSEADRIILKTLVNKQAPESDRLIAAELAGENVVISDEMSEALLAIVGSSSESEELRGKSAIALGPVLEQADTELIDEDEFDDPDAVPITLGAFRSIQDSLQRLYLDETIPRDVRRLILEAAVRSPQPWQVNAISAAYARGDPDWTLTAVFSMGYLRGFDDQIMEALQNPDPLIHYHAIRAAGTWEVEAAWDHIVAVLDDPATPKELRLAAIEAVGNIRPREALEILPELSESPDEEIAEAAAEALVMAHGRLDEADDEEDDEEEVEEEVEEEEDEGEWIN